MPGSTPLRILALGAAAVSIAIAGTVAAPRAAAGSMNAVNFGPTGAIQTWSVPPGVQSIGVAMAGGAGGTSAGFPTFTNASTATATLTVPPGVPALDVVVGLPGGVGVTAASGAGGWPNGGNGGFNGNYYGGGGGGSSDIRPSGAPFTSALIVSGGSGGTGGFAYDQGGAGGVGGTDAATPGQPGQGSDGGPGGAPGSEPTGASGQGGTGGGDPYNARSGGGGGGGGGWRGGGGGGAGTAWIVSYRSGGGGGGGGGLGSVVPQYVTGLNSYVGTTSSFVQLYYLTVTSTAPPATPAVGVPTYWAYDAGPGATFDVTSGQLPPGLSLDGYSGQVQGVPTKAGTFTFTVMASASPTGLGATATTATTSTVTVNPGSPATLVALGATNIGATSATLLGSVLAGDAPVTNLRCAYSTRNPGTGTITGRSVPATPASVYPSPTGAATSVSCAVTGLTGFTRYYWQLQGVQGSARVQSSASLLSTNLALAQPTTLPATGVGPTSATGNGTVSSTQKVLSIFCRASTNLAKLSTAAPRTAAPASTTGVITNRPVSCALPGLTPNSVYHYAVFARDELGTAISPTVQSFTTRVSPPRVGTITAGGVTSTTATITGSVIPTNDPVKAVRCRYVASPGNPNTGTAITASPARLSAAPVQRATRCSLSGLAPGTTYLVRMEASDVAGTAGSPNVAQFTTASSGTGGGGGGSSSAPAPTIAIRSVAPTPSGSLAIMVLVNRPGTVRVDGTYGCRADRATARAGTLRLACTLSPRARRTLAATALPIRLRATLTTQAGQAASATRVFRVGPRLPYGPPVTG